MIKSSLNCEDFPTALRLSTWHRSNRLRSHNRYFVNLSCVAWRAALLAHPPATFILLGHAGAGDVHRALAEALVDLVHGLHQFALIAAGFLKEQIALLHFCRAQVLQHDAGLGELVARLVDRSQAAHGRIH